MTQAGLNFQKFNTHSDSHERAFEAFCNHLFERWLQRTYGGIKDFQVINGEGGDGGIEAYGTLCNNSKVGIQAKWYPKALQPNQFKAIKRSILTAMTVHGELTEIILAVPRNLGNKKVVAKKTNKLATNNERARYNKLASEIKAVHPRLKLKLWGQHELEKECALLENTGLRAYWFDHTAIDFTYLQHQFEVAKNGWLSIRYIADLHTVGFMQHLIATHLRNSETRKLTVANLRRYTARLRSLIEKLNRVLPLDRAHVIGGFKKSVEHLVDDLERLAIGTEQGNQSLPTDFEMVDVQKFLVDLDRLEIEPPSNLRPVFNELPELIQDIRFEKNRKSLRLIALESHPQYLIFKGSPGTGKTHALANTIQKSLKDNTPALIIQAQHCPPQSWTSILRFGLGGALDNWSDTEILSALESLAHVCKVHNTKAGNNSTWVPRAIICIDGIDEAPTSTWPTWVIRINELASYVTKFPLIQFAISYRTSFHNDKIQWIDQNRIYDLPTSGDIPVQKLFPAYAKKYNTPDAPWVGYALTDLISLRLFCEIYQGKRGQKNIPIGTSLTQLVKRKIELIEEELERKLLRRFEKQDEILLKVLYTLARSLVIENRIQRTDLQTLIVAETRAMLNNSEASVAIALLGQYGIIREVLESKSEVGPSTYSYHVVHQSLIEFVLASRLANDVAEGKNIMLPSELFERPLVVQIASDILVTDHGIVPALSGQWSNVHQDRLVALALQSIATLPNEQVKQYTAWAKSEFVKSAQLRNLILQYWIVPSAKRPDSIIGAPFLHEILTNFNNTAERDLVWSGPGYYDGKNYDRISHVLERVELEDEDKHNELPLILAWSLTSVDNIFREKTRRRLTVWASRRLDQALQLAHMLFLRFDPQLDEDLALVLHGAASVQKTHSDELELLSDYLLDTIFAPEQIGKTRNTVVRHASRSVVEKTNVLKPIDEGRLKKCRPPYKAPFQTLPLATNKVRTSQDGRYPIQGDLAWYVIDDSFNSFMDYPGAGNKQEKNTRAFLQRYPGFSGGPFEFAISAAIAYIRSLGWLSQDGHSTTQATHGSLSRVSTFEEKYTWLAVRHIQGYLADYLPFKDDHDRIAPATNYTYFIGCYNPADAVSDLFFPEIKNRWLIPTDISSPLKFTKATLKEDIKKWVIEDQPLDDSWYQFSSSQVRNIIATKKKRWITLENYTSLDEPTRHCQSVANTIAMAVKKSDLEMVLRAVKKSRLWTLRDFDVDYLHVKSYVNSAIDAIWMDWVNDYYPTFVFAGAKIIKSICQVSAKQEDESITYHIPSKQFRKWLDVKTGNASIFLAGNGEIMAFNTNIGEHYHDRQELLLVDQKKLQSSMEKDGYMLLWALFMFRKTSPNITQEREKLHYQNCRLSLVWQEQRRFNEYVYHIGWARNSESELDRPDARVGSVY